VTPVATAALALVVLTAVVATAVAAPAPTLLGLSLAVAATAAAVDIVSRRIPDPLVVMAAAPTLIAVLHESSRVGGVLLGLALMAGPLLLLHLAQPAQLGFGDVKLAAALGAAMGLIDAHLSVLALALGTGLTLAAALVRRRSSVAFGPGLVVGALLALIISELVP
jgi:leader peptidase (prepilin peptidase)/N-methyltransferase